jgi:methionyl aminopeptidase
MVKTLVEIEKMKISCRKCKCILVKLGEFLKAGMTTKEIEIKSYELMLEEKVSSAFYKYSGYPGNICISVNEEVVHGIPSVDKVIKEGDIVSLDVGVIYNGFYGDCADTFPIGHISETLKKLIRVSKEAFRAGMEEAVAGSCTGNIGKVVQQYVEKNGFSVVKAFAGHGIGKSLHELPEVPNFDIGGEGEYLKENMVLAIEPMVNRGIDKVKVLDDKWTVVTEDGEYSSHHENCVWVRKGKAKILTEC